MILHCHKHNRGPLIACQECPVYVCKARDLELHTHYCHTLPAGIQNILRVQCIELSTKCKKDSTEHDMGWIKQIGFETSELPNEDGHGALPTKHYAPGDESSVASRILNEWSNLYKSV
uniref:Uncharacterized protein n=1 Tax=Oryza brachyantha TaxID=4533 RepID=J3N978_ORYBR